MLPAKNYGNLEKGMESDLLVDFQIILTRWKNHFWQLFTLHAVNDLMNREIYTAEQLVPEPSAFEDDGEIAIEELRSYKSPYTDSTYK